MAITLTATLLTAADPAPVQVVLTGMTAGQTFEVTATSTDGSSWGLSGGVGTSDGNQVVLIDNRSALNSTVTYVAVVDGVSYSSAPVTVTYSTGVAVLQTFDGAELVDVEISSVTDPRKGGARAEAFEIAGREDPAFRLDIATSYEYGWTFDTELTASQTMRRIVKMGRVIVRRTITGMRDLDPVVVGIITNWSDELLTDGYDTWRRWKLTVREIGTPQAGTALAAFNWDDFDAAMTDRIWSYQDPAMTYTNATGSTPGSGGYADGGAFRRATAVAASTAVTAVTTAAVGAAAAADVKSVTVAVKGTAGRSVSATITWSGGTVTTGTPVTLTGSWQLITVTGTAPGGTTSYKAGVSMAATGVVIGTQLDFDALAWVAGPDPVIGVFDDLFATWDQFDATDWALLT